VKYNLKEDAALDAWADLTECGYWFPFEGLCFVSEKPVQIRIDGQGNLHNESGPSMLFGDGYYLWNFHGTTVPREVIEHPELITAKACLEEENAEARRVMCERMGWPRFVEEANLKLVHECPDPGNPPNVLRLYDTPELILDTPVRLLLCTNGTPKPNGEVPQYGITVPQEISVADEAAAWIANVPVEMYRLMQRRT
jgi:hypothetical protein